MRRFAFFLAVIMLAGLTGLAWGASTDAVPQTDGTDAKAGTDGAVAPPGADSTEPLQQELEKLKKEVAALEARLKAQEQQSQLQKHQPAAPPSEVAASLKELDQRVSDTERGQALDRLHFSGDYRFEAHNIIRPV